MNRSNSIETEPDRSAAASLPLTARILLVEDDPLDAELVLDRLREDGLDLDARVVQDQPAYCQALREFQADIVLSDLSLPGFSGERALELLRERDQLTPFVYVSGTIGETAAIQALRGGATDYILKSSMARLASAVRRAIAEAAERRARDSAERELVRAQRFETLAILAGSLGHDLRNTLQPVLMAADLIEARNGSEEIARLCTMIRDCSRQGLDLVSAMLTLARGGQGSDGKRIRLSALLDAIGMLLKPSLAKGVELAIAQVDPNLEIPGNATELQQCLLNLALNAAEAMPEGGTLEIGAEPFEPDEGFFGDDEKRHGTAYVRISVADSGLGMDQATLARLFTPFFTTKEKGTGLGLVSCRRFIQNHRGVIRVDSRPGHGSRFDLYLPVEAVEAPAHADAANDGDELVGRGERVLVVAAERSDREKLADILDLYGYVPVPAPDGETAQAHLAAGDPVKVAIVDRDLVLLGNGGNVAVRLRSAGYDGPLVVVGAVGRSEGVGGNGGAAAHLSKPVTAAALLQALRSALGPAGAAP
jgi:signal transduction histidine kinase